MKTVLLALAFVLTLGATTASQPAATPQPAPASQPAVVVGAPVVTTVSGTAESMPGPAEIAKDAKEALTTAVEVVKQTKEYATGKVDAANSTEKALVILGIVTLVLKLLLSLLKVATPFLKGPKAGLIIRLSTVGVGVLVFLFSNLTLGMPWWDALIAAIGGPGALFFHEISKVFPWFQTKEDPKPAEPPK